MIFEVSHESDNRLKVWGNIVTEVKRYGWKLISSNKNEILGIK